MSQGGTNRTFLLPAAGSTKETGSQSRVRNEQRKEKTKKRNPERNSVLEADVWHSTPIKTSSAFCCMFVEINFGILSYTVVVPFPFIYSLNSLNIECASIVLQNNLDTMQNKSDFTL